MPERNVPVSGGRCSTIGAGTIYGVGSAEPRDSCDVRSARSYDVKSAINNLQTTNQFGHASREDETRWQHPTDSDTRHCKQRNTGRQPRCATRCEMDEHEPHRAQATADKPSSDHSREDNAVRGQRTMSPAGHAALPSPAPQMSPL